MIIQIEVPNFELGVSELKEVDITDENIIKLVERYFELKQADNTKQ